MSVQIPFGLRDYLPDHYKNKKLAETRMSEVFSSYGYKPVSTPTIEYYDNFADANYKLGNKMFKMTDSDGSLLVLRPDVTIQICRMYVTNMTGIQRMYYNLDSFEYLCDENSSRDREFAQMGVELLGDNGGVDSEVELLTMAIDALLATGLKNFTIDIGHVGFFEGIAEEYGISDDDTKKLKNLINKKDMLGVELFFKDKGISTEAKNSILSLPILFGDTSVLDKAEKLCVNSKSKDAITRLRKLTDKLNNIGLLDYISIDLGLLSCNDYYTGVVFKGMCDGVGSSILDGGRYDRLCDRMGKHTNAVGFAIGVRRVLIALKTIGKWEKAQKADVAYAVINCDDTIVRNTISKIRKKQIAIQIFGDENDLINYCKEKGVSRAILFDGDAVEINLSKKGDKV